MSEYLYKFLVSTSSYHATSIATSEVMIEENRIVVTITTITPPDMITHHPNSDDKMGRCLSYGVEKENM